MSVEIEYNCNKCKFSLSLDEDCLCDDCVETIKQEAYDEGYKNATNELKD